MQTLQMDEKQWAIAHDIAFELVDRGTDPNELGKIIAFMRRDRDNSAKDQLMSLVQRMANSNNAPIRSRQTQRFYGNIQDACKKHLQGIDETDELLRILGWSLRLMRYYHVEPKRAAEEQRTPRPAEEQQKVSQQLHVPKQQATQTTKPLKQAEKPKVKRGDKVNATILKKDGSKVTVRLRTDHNEEVVFERPYYPGLVGAQIKVRVLEVNEDGKVKEVIP